MLYEIKSGQLHKVDWEDYEAVQEQPLIACMGVDTLQTRWEELKIPDYVVKRCKTIDTAFRSSMQIEGDLLYGSLTVIDVLHMNRSRCQCSLILQKKRLYIICVLEEEKEIENMLRQALKRYEKKITLERILFAFLDGFLAGGNEALEKMEKQIVQMEHELVENRMDERWNKEIFFLKKQLSILKNYYEQMVDVGESIRECEVEVLGYSESRYVTLFTEKAKRLSKGTQDIRESVIHLREALDANLEYNLNRIMKVFTVVTTVFLPLTLIAGWYGMNFEFMPELHWKYGYVMVWMVSIIVVLGSILFFAKKKLL